MATVPTMTPIGGVVPSPGNNTVPSMNAFDYANIFSGAALPFVSTVDNSGIGTAAINSLFATTGSFGSSNTSNLTTGFGSTGMSYATGGSTLSSNGTDLDAMQAENVATQSYLLGMQMQIGQSSTQFSALSNIIKTKDDTARGAIQNFR